MPTNVPCFAGHTGSVLDFDFNPFDDSLIASGSEDTTIKLWGIPEGGLTKNITEALVTLNGHSKKVTHLNFHPTASNCLLSASADQTVKIWDIEKGYEINSMSEATELFQGVCWNHNGDEYAVSSKDKSIRIVDARSLAISSTIENAHEGSKSIKLTYLGAHNKLCSVGFTKQSGRQLKIWDPRNTAKSLQIHDMDQAAGVIMPFYDPDTNMLYLSGKGDGNIRYFEIDENSTIFPLGDFRSSVSAKGMCAVPKRGLNVLATEVMRMLKLTTNSVEPLSFRVPRKAEGFQEDLFPDSFSGTPSHTCDEWFGGSSKDPVMMSLDPALRQTGADAGAKGPAKPFVAAKSPMKLMSELEAANKRIEQLTKRLEDAGLKTD